MEITQLKRFIELNSPILFLGAGFNAGLMKDNKSIPLGDSLKIELIEVLESNGINDKWEEYSLQDISEIYIDELGNISFSEFLVNRFSGYKPSQNQLKLTNYSWKKIYTTNIDDVIENIFDKNDIRFIIQNSKNRRRNTNNVTEIIKLHGCVRNHSEGFVFSKLDYFSNFNNDFRFSSLSQDLIYEPFIIVGSNFEEDHISAMLKQIMDANKVTQVQNKTFLITPSLNAKTQRYLNKINGIWLQHNADDFLNIIGDINIQRQEKINIQIKNTGFLHVNPSLANVNREYKTNLYWGEHPTWDDISNNLDIINTAILNKVKNELINTQKHIALIGNRCSGKSTLLKRIGYMLVQKEYSVWEYKEDIFAWSSWCYHINRNKHNTKYALLVDDASRFYFDIRKLFKAIDADTNLLLVTTSSAYLHYKKKYALAEDQLCEIIVGKPNEQFIIDTHSKLTELGLLGELRKIDDVEGRINKLKEYSDISSMLFSITYGDGFKKRFEDIFTNNITNSTCKKIIQLLYIFDILDISYLPHDLLIKISKDDNDLQIRDLTDIIREKERRGYSLRNTYFRQLISTTLHENTSLSLIKEIVNIVAPNIDEGVESIHKEIFTMLIRPKEVVKRLKINKYKFLQMLYSIRELYDWSYNYWLQLGIAEQMNGDYDIALNHLRQAESIHPTSYMVHNAIGRNYLRKANSLRSYSEALPFIKEGTSILKELIYSRDTLGARGYSIHSLISELVSLSFKFNEKIPKKEYDEYKKLADEMVSRNNDDPMVDHLMKLISKYEHKFSNKTYKWDELGLVKAVLSEEEIYDLVDSF